MIDFTSIASMGPIIPFLFVFGVIYGSLEVANVFKGNRGVNFVIAAAVAIIAMSNYGMVEFIYSIIPYATIAFIIIFAIMFLKKTVFAGIGKVGGGKGVDFSLVIIILMLIFVFLGNVNQSALIDIPFVSNIDEGLMAILGIGLIVLILLFAYFKDPIGGGGGKTQ
ncbi:MAG: hypothetical protein JW716_02005 [Candidatus Aenigmarchaeota archaeon]|nr:hypothetical protein [Candidatus Aenigmarchaeota archaeon]